eukprot:jgi/Picsp_1/5078/NSC_02441-R1_hypothetical chloroplast rf66
MRATTRLRSAVRLGQSLHNAVIIVNSNASLLKNKMKYRSVAQRRKGAHKCVAMVNVDVSPSVILGVGLIGSGVSLWQIRQTRPWISKDYDVVVSCISLLVGGILIFQGWRLDPLLLFGQLMTTGAALSFAVEALRLRNEVYEQEERNSLKDAFERRRADGRRELPPGEFGGGPPPPYMEENGWETDGYGGRQQRYGSSSASNKDAELYYSSNDERRRGEEAVESTSFGYDAIGRGGDTYSSASTPGYIDADYYDPDIAEGDEYYYDAEDFYNSGRRAATGPLTPEDIAEFGDGDDWE